MPDWEAYRRNCPNCGEPIWFWSAEFPDDDYHFGCDECGYAESYEWDESSQDYKKIRILHMQRSSLPVSDFPVSIQNIRKVKSCFGKWEEEGYCEVCDFAQECKVTPDHVWQKKRQREEEIKRLFEEKSRGCEWEYRQSCSKCRKEYRFGRDEWGFFWHGKDGLAHFWCPRCGHEEEYNDCYDYFAETISPDEDMDDFDKAIGMKI